MILVFGGTTEGRIAVSVCEEAGKPYFYSTKGNLQKIDAVHAKLISGGLDEKQIVSFCTENSVKLIVDAAHPFAEALHRNIANASQELDIPVVRYERNYPECDNRLFWFDSYTAATEYLNANNVENLLALTGVNTIAKLKPYWEKHNCWFRILDRDESRQIVRQSGFPNDKILYYHQADDEKALFAKLKPQAVITKESGDSGGFSEKVEAAFELNIPVLVVKRPVLSSSFITVYGKHGLRKQIEQLLPGFFDLKTGYTTGSCATAATKAALLALLTNIPQSTVNITLPDGEVLELPVAWTKIEDKRAASAVVKDAGDDPDVTNGLEIVSSVTLNASDDEIRFLQGEGVGRVTLPGLGLDVGSPAINATPRRMMVQEVRNILQQNKGRLPIETCGVDITISVPQGEIIAQKTFNPKLGIEGGISIIGTSGIVKPFSSEAFVGSIRKEMEVAIALGCEHVIINSGAKSEKFIKQLFPGYPAQAFIHYGNFIGETIKIAAELGFPRLTLGVMIGKAVKLAEGALDTHSKKVIMNKAFLVSVAEQSGCSRETIEKVAQITLARQLWEIIPDTEYGFFHLLLNKCHAVCAPLFPNGDLIVLLIEEEGKIIS